MLNDTFCIYGLCVLHEVHYIHFFVQPFAVKGYLTLIWDLLNNNMYIKGSTQMIILGASEVNNGTVMEINNCKISDDHLTSFYNCSTVLQYWLMSMIASLFVALLFKKSQMKILFDKRYSHIVCYWILLEKQQAESKS